MTKKKAWKPALEFRDPSTLIPYERNINVHTKAQIDALAGSIAAYGFDQPIVVDPQGVIIKGHCRREAAIALGLKEVPVVVADHLTEDQVRASRIADKKVSEAPWDTDMLKFELGALDLSGFDMKLTGFELPDLKGFLEEGEIAPEMFRADPVASPEIERAPVAQVQPLPMTEPVPEEDTVPEGLPTLVKVGEVWSLGRHRLVCGDATKHEDVERLMQGEKAELCFTSPPYADQREYGDGKELSTQYLARFIRAANETVQYFAVNLGYSRKDGEVNPYWDDYIREAKECGLRLLSWNIWDRGSPFSLGQQTAMFPIEHEWVFVFGERPKSNNLTVPNKHFGEITGTTNREADGSMSLRKEKEIRSHRPLGTILRQDVERRSAEFGHPAMFPVDFPLKYIESMTSIGDVVYEPFGGSGSTLIACEKTGRACRMMELDPYYCTVILRRFAEFSGEDPVRSDGVKFSDLLEASNVLPTTSDQQAAQA